MEKINFNIGDTNFLALVNAVTYLSFVDEDWDLTLLRNHWNSEAQKGSILVFGMTEEGNEVDWLISTEFDEINSDECYRRTTGFIEVTSGELYFVEYTCLTMAAQFADEKVPDKACSKYKLEIENGLYKVDIIQYYNADNDEHIGNDDIDIRFIFTEIQNRTVLSENLGLYWFEMR